MISNNGRPINKKFATMKKAWCRFHERSAQKTDFLSLAEYYCRAKITINYLV